MGPRTKRRNEDVTMQGKAPTISLCAIAKDEEQFIAEMIESVKPLVSEIILVDTGSSDRTVEIVEEMGGRVFHRLWDDDFSAPRNLSIEQASGDWILVLDADEMIDESDHEKIRRLIQDPSKAYLLTQRHYSDDHRLSSFEPAKGEFPHWEKHYLGYFESSLCRLFPRRPEIEYRGRIHELVEHSIHEVGDVELLMSGIRIHHYGHTPEVKKKKKKGNLYTPLGIKKTEEQPTTWKGYYELGVEHNCNDRREESAAAFTKAVELNPDYVPSWVNFGYVLTELGRYKEALDALAKALELEPENPEAHCNMGVMYMRTESHIMAESHLRRAISLKPDYVNAYSNLGLTLFKLGDVQGAAKIFQQAYQLAPRNITLLTRFAFSLIEVGIIEEATVVLEEAMKINENDEGVWYCLSQAYQKLNQPDRAREAADRLRQIQASSS